MLQKPLLGKRYTTGNKAANRKDIKYSFPMPIFVKEANYWRSLSRTVLSWCLATSPKTVAFKLCIPGKKSEGL